jgi:hypothetical protein
MRTERDPQHGQMPKETTGDTINLTPLSVISERTTEKPGGKSCLRSNTWLTTEVETCFADDPIAVAHEIKVRSELNTQYRELRRQAQEVFDALKGRISARNEDNLAEVFAKAHIDYVSGQFLMQRLGADRQLDLPLVATLTQLHQTLLDGIEHATAADHMNIDGAIMAYRNMLRVQGWLGSLCLDVERQLFGQISPNAVLDRAEAKEVLTTIEKIEHHILPILEKNTAHAVPRAG